MTPGGIDAYVLDRKTARREKGPVLRRVGLCMKAIISDIHGNLEALEAVLEDIRSREIAEIVCLGDVIGYGPDPRECLERVRGFDVLIRGNHEDAVLKGEASAFHRAARDAVEWTRKQLFGPSVPEKEAEEIRGFMESFKITVDIEGIRYVHGSPRDPIKEYITPRDARNKKKMGEIFAATDTVFFIGHSHTPGVFTEEGFSSPEDLSGLYILAGEKALVNVGSVGQPRDGDPRASYVTFDVDTVVFRRVVYNVKVTVDKIWAIPGLDKSLAERLLLGK